MGQLVQFILLLHIVTAITMLAGWIGRQLTRAQAAQATDIQVFHTLTQLSGRFESWLVIPGSLLVFVFGLLIAWLRGWPILGFLQGASSNWLLVSLILYLAVYPLVIFVFLPRGKVFGKALDEALVQGRITPELTAAFHDRAVWLAHVVEAILIVAMVYLMVMKPF
jgi:uncharacterized membrane protein